MKKIYTLFAVLAVFTCKISVAQTWVDMMQDPSVNFYDVQKAFNQYFDKGKQRELRHEQKEEARERREMSEQAAKNAKSGRMVKDISREKGEAKEVANFELYKRWEDFMRPRLFPTGDRSLMINAWNEYLNSYSSGPHGGTRAASPSAPTTAAANWTLIGPTTSIPAGGGAGRVNFVRFDPLATSTMYVGSPGGGFWKSTTSGTSWTTTTDQLPLIGCTDLAINPSNGSVMYLATGDGEAQDTYSIGVYKSTDAGATWTITGLNWAVTNFRSISRLLINPQNPNVIFAASSNGIYRTYNAGTTWTQITGTAGLNFKDIEYRPTDTTTIYATTTTKFYKSTNGGTSFTNITTGLPASTVVSRLAIGVTANDPTYVYVLAADATNYGFTGLYRSTDNGTTFTTRSTSPNLLGFNSTGSDVGGQGWYTLSIAVSPINKNLVLVGGVNIWKSADGGATWTLNAHWTGTGAPYVHADIHALEFIPGSATTYFAGCDGGCFKTTTTGTSWSDLSNGLQIAQAYRLGLSASSTNLLVTGWQDNGTNRNNGTATWNYIQGGDGMEAAIDNTNSLIQYGELYYGQINKTTTGGNLTTSIVASGGTGVNADGDWVTPYILNPQKNATMVVGKAQAYRSRNRGGTWSALGTVTGGTGNLNALAYAPSDSNYLYMSKLDKFYTSTNSGTSFTDRTAGLPVASASISYIAVASNNPQHVWVTFSGYSAANKVWYSADAGVTWSNYTTGLPNLPANCIVYQNGSTNDALYVGTDVGVYYRDNTAGSWVTYNTGLPNVIVKELEIQYTAAKLRAATFGRGIWQSDLYNPGTALPVADFSANRVNICVGDCINFTDLSTGSPTSWSWTFTGAATASSTLQNPINICYNTAGTYAVSMTATNANGSNTMTKTAYITVSSPIALPLVEGFQLATFPPSGWSVTNPDGDNTWVRSTAAGGFATSTASTSMDNYSPPTSIVGTKDELWTPRYNFTGLSSATMTFDVAYARYNSTYTDSLICFVSTNCGVTWTAVYNKGGFTGLQTAPDLTTAAFVPTSTQWRTETVSLTPYIGQPNVMVKFQNYSGWGQMMYLDNINITGVASPVASVVIAQTTGTNPMCAGQSATFTATPTNGGTTPSYQWQVNGVNVGTGGTTYTTTTLANGDIVTCVMTSSLPGVTGSPATSNAITMVVNPAPATPTAGSNSPVCAGASINLTTPTVAGATYSWTGPSSFTSTSQNPVRTGATAAMAGTYSVTVTTGGCTSAAGTVTVVVNPLPATPAPTSNSPVCAGSSILLSTAAVAGATYAWTGPSSFTSALQNPSRPSSTIAMAGTYSLTVTVGGCTSAAGTTAVVVNPVPATPTAGSNSPVCAGSSINLTTPTVAGATYAWTGPSAFSSAVQNPVISGATAAMAGTYSVTVTTAGCTSLAGTTSVVVNPTPATPVVTASSPVCSGSTITLSTPNVGGATYSWTGPNSFTSAIRNPSIPAATVAASGTYSVTVTTGGCTSAPGTGTVVVNPTPATPSASSNSPVCLGSSILLSTPTVAGATYSWTGPAAFSSTAQNPIRPSATATMAGTYSVTVTVAGCTSPVGTTAVVVNTTVAPTISIALTGGTNPSCAGQALTFTATAGGGGTTPIYQWQVNGANVGTNSTTFTSSTITSGQVVTCVLTSSSPCASPLTATSNSITITVNPVPSTPAVTASSPVCTGSTINLSTATVAGATYTWTGPAAFASSLQNPSRPSATTAMAGTYSLTVTVSGCISNAGTAAVVVNTTPSTPVAGSNSPVCTGSPINLTTGTVAGAMYSWSGPGFTSSSQNPVIASASLSMAGTYSVTVIVSGCTSAPGTTTVVVNSSVTPSVAIAITAGSNPTCAGAAVTFTATPTNGGTAPVYDWLVNGVSTGVSTSTYTTSTLNNSDVVTCVMTSNEICASPATVTSAGITMTVNPVAAPTVVISIISGSNPSCAGSPVTFFATITNGGAAPTYQWQINGANAGTNASTFTSSTLNSGDIVTCIVTSSSACASPATATSAGITMTVNPIPPTPVISQSGDTLISSASSGNQWYESGLPIAGATGQTFVPGANGNYTVIVTLGGCSSSSSAVYPVTNTGLSGSEDPYGLNVWPNPNDGHFNVSFSSGVAGSFSVELHNALGQLIFHDELKNWKGNYNKNLSVTEYGKGVYTISITNEKNETVKRIIVY